ncbi:hypothetical protein J6590_100171 [Homalodisca vitripennis]|nr:hypothetical protein J6590_100171 [Homalodisca vitripennis]
MISKILDGAIEGRELLGRLNTGGSDSHDGVFALQHLLLCVNSLGLYLQSKEQQTKHFLRTWICSLGASSLPSCCDPLTRTCSSPTLARVVLAKRAKQLSTVTTVYRCSTDFSLRIKLASHLDFPNYQRRSNGSARLMLDSHDFGVFSTDRENNILSVQYTLSECADAASAPDLSREGHQTSSTSLPIVLQRCTDRQQIPAVTVLQCIQLKIESFALLPVPFQPV